MHVFTNHACLILAHSLVSFYNIYMVYNCIHNLKTICKPNYKQYYKIISSKLLWLNPGCSPVCLLNVIPMSDIINSIYRPHSYKWSGTICIFDVESHFFCDFDNTCLRPFINRRAEVMRASTGPELHNLNITGPL